MKNRIRIILLLTILFLFVILSGCIRPEASTLIQNENPASTPLTIPELNLKLGEIAKLPGMEATVN